MFATDFGSLDVVALVAIVVLLLAAAALAGAEEALTRTNKVRAESMADNEPKRVKRLLQLLDNLEGVLKPLRLVILMLQAAQITLVALLANRFFPPAIVVAIVALNVAIVFVVAEAAPRTLGILRADRSALMMARTVEAITLFGPIRLLANWLITLTNVLVPGKGLLQGPFHLARELVELADQAVVDEVIQPGERDLIESVIEFSSTIVREVMIPRTDMKTIGQYLTVAEALGVTSEAGFSRVPAVGGTVDDIKGLVYVKDLIREEISGNADSTVQSILRSANFVPETKKVSDLLKEMQAQQFHMAIAVDEYGGIAGLVTLEDLIEELVGEIVDEYDVAQTLVERQVDGSLRVDARIPVDELNSLGGMELPEGDWDTVGGLVFDLFGRVPIVGESEEVNGYTLRVERLHGRRITRVKISKPVGDEAETMAELDTASE